jgi:gamma-glutamyltranspeptidase/glutathione hydrolase
MFALYFKAETGQVSALNGSGRAPATLTLERLAREGLLANALPPFHAYTVTVPGACAGWLDLLEWHGSLSPAEVLEPAIALAEDGFPVAPLTSLFWRRGVERRLGSAPNGKELTVDGRAPRAGELFRNPGLARTLRTVAEGGKGAFYEGPIARAIAEVVQQAGGCLTEADLAAHVSTWEEPISVPYGGYRVYECPPNGQGLATLIALNILGGFDLARSKLLSPESLHLQIEAMRLAFADARWYVADPDFSDIPIVQLLSADYAAERRKLIDPRVAIVDLQRGLPERGGSIRECLLLHQQQLHGLWHGHRAQGLGLQLAEPWPQLQP